MNNLPDITGTGVTVQIASPNITARWIQYIVSGTGTARFGGSNVSATLGLPVPAGGGLFLPVQSVGADVSPYSLAGEYAYIPAGAIVSVGYLPFN